MFLKAEIRLSKEENRDFNMQQYALVDPGVEL